MIQSLLKHRQTSSPLAYTLEDNGLNHGEFLKQKGGWFSSFPAICSSFQVILICLPVMSRSLGSTVSGGICGIIGGGGEEHLLHWQKSFLSIEMMHWIQANMVLVFPFFIQGVQIDILAYSIFVEHAGLTNKILHKSKLLIELHIWTETSAHSFQLSNSGLQPQH